MRGGSELAELAEELGPEPGAGEEAAAQERKVRVGPLGEGHVRFALVENEQRIRQAVRGIARVLREQGVNELSGA